jgi:hypothetical protein
MTSSPMRLTDHLGREYMLIPAYQVEPWSYETARENLLSVLRDGIGADEVRRLAERCGFAGEPWNIDAIASCVAEEIASGRLVVVSQPEPFSGMRPLMGLNDPTDVWGCAVPLSSLSQAPVEEPSATWLEVQFVDPWWRPFTGMTLEVELPTGDVLRRGLDREGRLRIDALAGPRRPCRAWIPADAAVPSVPFAGARSAVAETGRARRGGAPIQLPLETHNVIIVEVPHVPSW